MITALFAYACGTDYSGIDDAIDTVQDITEANIPNPVSHTIISGPNIGSALPGPKINAPALDLRITKIQPDHGPTAGNITVSIIGQGLTPASKVFFGKNECLYPFFIAPTVFNCTTPPNSPGMVDVRIEVPARGDAILKHGFTYESPVRLQSVSPDTGRTQGGEPVVITGSGFDDSCVFMLGDRVIAGVTIKDDGHAYGLTPPGMPGPADLTMICDRGEDKLTGVFTYFDPGTLPNSEKFRILAVDPPQGPAKGGTKVMIFGKNLVPGLNVTFGGIPAISAKVVSDTIIKAVTPPGSPGPVDVTVGTNTRESRLRNRFTYLFGALTILSVSPNSASIAGNGLIDIVGTDFTPDLNVFFGSHKAMDTQFMDANHIFARAPAVDNPETVSISVVGPGKIAGFSRPFSLFNPMRTPGGAYGPPIDRTINLAVLTQGRVPVHDAMVVVNNMVMRTNKQGLVTLSEHGIRGPVTVTATMDGYSASTYAGLNATNITLAISKKPDPDTVPPDPVKPTYCVFEGRIRDFDKYGINQSGNTTHRLVYCSTSYNGIYGSNPDPGTAAIPDEDGNFKLTTRSGKLAILCTLSINRGKGFMAERMGIASGYVCSKDRPVTKDVVVDLNIPMHRSVFLRFSDLPDSPLGTKGPMTRFRFHLNYGGYVDFNSKIRDLFGNILELPGQPDCIGCLNGKGYSFDLYAHEATQNGMPYTRVMAKGLMPPDTTQAMIIGSDGDAKVMDLALPWRVTAAAAKGDFMVVAGSTGMVAMGTPDALNLGPIKMDSKINALFVGGQCDFYMGLENGDIVHCDCKECQDMAGMDSAVNALAIIEDRGMIMVLSGGRLMTQNNGKYEQVGAYSDFTSLTGSDKWYAVGGMDGRIMKDPGNGLVMFKQLNEPVFGMCDWGGNGLVAVTNRHLWMQKNDLKIEIPGKNQVFGVVCAADGPIVFGDRGMAIQYRDKAFHKISADGLHTAFTTGCVVDGKAFLSGVTYMETSEFLEFPELTMPKEGATDWNGQTIAWMPMRAPEPSFCQVLLSQPGVWTFWVILTGNGQSIIDLPNLSAMAGYDIVPDGAKALNVTCGLKPGFDFNNFSRYDTGLYNLPAYSVNMSHFQ